MKLSCRVFHADQTPVVQGRRKPQVTVVKNLKALLEAREIVVSLYSRAAERRGSRKLGIAPVLEVTAWGTGTIKNGFSER